MTIEYIQTDKAPSAIGAYSQAVKLDNIISVSYTHLTLPTTSSV